MSERVVPSRPAAAPAAAPQPSATPAALARGALRRLAQAQLEPTPENYARAYADEAGQAAPAAGAAVLAQQAELAAQGEAWATLLERTVRGVERGGREWTAARRKDSLARVLASSRQDAPRLQQRLTALLAAWEGDRAAEGLDVLDSTGAPGEAPWAPLWQALHDTLGAGLPPDESRARALADELVGLGERLRAEGPVARVLEAVAAVCGRAQRLFAHRHHLVEELGQLCRELALGLTELAEDDSWTRGQCERLQATLGEGAEEGSRVPSARSVRAATVLLAETRERQRQIKNERQAAREALKTLIQRMVSEAGELGDEAGRFSSAMSEHARAIEGADTLESLAGVVRTMLEESHAVQAAVNATRERLRADQERARELETRVDTLERELRRMSDEASTDALTQVANRRGLAQAFAALVAGCLAHDPAAPEGRLSVGLLDIDNFKKLNDSLGHAAGDEALKSLAAAVRERLRPGDHIARFGGEEFVVLLPGLDDQAAQQVMSRLQRSLSAGLFMHEGRDVFVTFSAGVTAWRHGEALEVALERADEALYQAKSSGKNRTCTA